MDWLLVLGASSDIAKAGAVKFASQGWNIILAGRQADNLKLDADDLSIKFNIKTEAVYFDVLDLNSHEEFYNKIINKPKVVLCAVGYLGDQKIAESNFNEANKIIATNFTGCISIINIISNEFEKLREGSIIVISSVAGDRGRASNYFYGSAKAGLSAYLSGLRNRLFNSGVNVITIKPGFVDTKMTEGMKLPPVITAQPENVGNDIYNAFLKKKNVIYSKGLWKIIMLIIIHIPESIFKKLKL